MPTTVVFEPARAIVPSASAVRRLWHVVEPYHALVYFAPEVRDAMRDAGVTGFWRGYFAARAAPLGEVPANVVSSLFFGFAPSFVERALADVWHGCPPSVALAARLDGIDRAVEAHLDRRQVRRIANLVMPILGTCAEHAPSAGRPMYAANATLPVPEQPHLALWHAATLLREHRGDGHVAALVAADVDACESHVLRLAATGADPTSILPHRGWGDDDWAAARERLRRRGWLDAEFAITPDGRAARDRIEADTDRAAARFLAGLDDDAVERVIATLRPLADRLADRVIPYPNAMGLPRPG